jgi:hypothetical protein
MTHMGKKRSILVGKSNRHTPLAVERKYRNRAHRKKRVCSNWIYVVHNLDKFCAVLNMVMNLWVSLNIGNFLTGI